MALTQTREQIRDNVRRLANVQGASALLRHPLTDLNDYINRGLSRLRFLLTQANPDQRYLASTTVTTSDGTSLYSLPSDFGFLISVDITANGAKTWLTTYEMSERPALTSPDQPASGIPFCYRLRGGNIEFLPEPGGAYTATLWYVPHTTELASDASVLDTINRLDEYVVAHAARLIAIKDKNWDLKQAATELMAELTSEIEVLGRTRDTNSAARVVDTFLADRWGRRRRA
jgi:hypothetical protein